MKSDLTESADRRLGITHVDAGAKGHTMFYSVDSTLFDFEKDSLTPVDAQTVTNGK